MLGRITPFHSNCHFTFTWRKWHLPENVVFHPLVKIQILLMYWCVRLVFLSLTQTSRCQSRDLRPGQKSRRPWCQSTGTTRVRSRTRHDTRTWIIILWQMPHTHLSVCRHVVPHDCRGSHARWGIYLDGMARQCTAPDAMMCTTCQWHSARLTLGLV